MVELASPLVSIDELAALPDPVVVDVRWYLGKPGAGRDAYLAGHIPGAIFLDLDADLSDPHGLGAPGRHPLPSPAEFQRRMAAAGIGDGRAVVAYDDSGGTIAARLWWMLDNLGFGRRGIEGELVGVLDAGILAWTRSGRDLETGERSLPAARLSLEPEWHGVIERQALKDRLGEVLLIDARATPRYRGETEPVDPVPGHIPTAINLPLDGNLADGGRFLAPDALRRRFSALGLEDPGERAREVVISCGSGTTSCHHALAMRAAGLPDPILYVGSYSDWSRSGEPIATGADPGAALN